MTCAVVALALGCEHETLRLLPEENGRAAAEVGDDGDKPVGAGGQGSEALGGAPSVEIGGSGGEAASETMTALIINSAPPNTDDEEFEARLTSLGLEVRNIAQDEANQESLAFSELIVVAPSADRAVLAAKLAPIPRPQLILEPAVATAQSLGSYVSLTSSKTRIEIVDPTSPLASGLAGVVEVCSSPALVLANGPPSAAHVTARPNLNLTAAVLYTMEKGIIVAEAALPADRIVFSLLHPRDCRTEPSWILFDASVKWLLRNRP